MYNWNTDISKLKKNPHQYSLWKLVQLINYGLDGDKLNKNLVKKSWPEIESQLDPYKKRALEYLIWDKLYSLPNNLNFWSASK